MNLTEVELNRVDIRVGLSGGLYFMDGTPQAVRQLRDLNSQVKLDYHASLLHHVYLPFLFECFQVHTVVFYDFNVLFTSTSYGDKVSSLNMCWNIVRLAGPVRYYLAR